MTHSFPTRRSSDLPLNLIDGRDLRWHILGFETELDLGHRSALPYLPPLNSEVSQLINLSFCLFEHLATELREILIHDGRYAQRSTQRCHIAIPSRLATLDPTHYHLIELERQHRSKRKHRLPH